MINITIKILEKYKFSLVLLFFSIHQLYYIPRVGVWWDEPYDQLGMKLTIGKLKYLIFGIETREYRADFSDHEFFGMFYQAQAYLFSKLGKLFYSFDLDLLNIESEIHFVYFFRHVYLHLYICLCLYIIYFLLKKIQSADFGFMYVLFLVLIPSINGYSLFDDKDIPFGLNLQIAFLCYIYFFKIYNSNERVSQSLVLLTGISFGLLLLIRFNGVAFLILLLIAINIQRLKNILETNFIFKNIQIGFYALCVFFIGTIQGLSNYYNYLKNLYWQQFKVSTWSGETIVNGQTFYKSGDTSYIFKILLFKLPIIYLLALFVFFIFYKKVKNNLLAKSGLVFLLLFFGAFIAFKPAAYNYERQYIFIFFFINLLVAFCFSFLESKKLKYFSIFIFIISTIYSQSGLKEYKYVYVNELVNEKLISTINQDCLEFGNCGIWSTDHLSTSGISMANMIEKAEYPVFSCAPFHTISIFNKKNNFINLDNKYIFKSGVDTMDYTLERINDSNSDEIKTVFKNRELFNSYLLENNVKRFLIISEHILTSNGNDCLNKLRSNNKLDCKIKEENTVSLRSTKITINYLLECSRNV